MTTAATGAAKKGHIKPAGASAHKDITPAAPEHTISSDESDINEKVYNTVLLNSTDDEQEPASSELSPIRIRKASPEELTDDDNPLSSYQHLRVKGRASPDGESFDICGDPGAGRSLID